MNDGEFYKLTIDIHKGLRFSMMNDGLDDGKGSYHHHDDADFLESYKEYHSTVNPIEIEKAFQIAVFMIEKNV